MIRKLRWNWESYKCIITYNIPVWFQTNNEREFITKFFKFCESNEIAIFYGISYNPAPRSNGGIE